MLTTTFIDGYKLCWNHYIAQKELKGEIMTLCLCWMEIEGISILRGSWVWLLNITSSSLDQSSGSTDWYCCYTVGRLCVCGQARIMVRKGRSYKKRGTGWPLLLLTVNSLMSWGDVCVWRTGYEATGSHSPQCVRTAVRKTAEKLCLEYIQLE